MTADYPPFMNAYGNVTRILNKIKEAQTPDRFTHDFLETELGFSGGGARPFVSFAKRLGLLASDGTPTELYKSFRNPDESGAAVAQAMKNGYSDLYRRNEFAHSLDRKGLEGLVMAATGLEKGNGTLRSIVGSFEALKGLADFKAPVSKKTGEKERDAAKELPPGTQQRLGGQSQINLAHTIYLNLPNTSDIAVFNAIFKSLRENLLSE